MLTLLNMSVKNIKFGLEGPKLERLLWKNLSQEIAMKSLELD